MNEIRKQKLSLFLQ